MKKSLYEECYEEMRQRILDRGYHESHSHTCFSERYARLHVAINDGERALAEMKESLDALLREFDSRYPLETEGREV